MFSTPVRQLIEPRKLLVAAPQATVREAANMMASRAVGAVLVVADSKLLGIFTERDVVFRVVARGLDPDATRLAAVMTPEPKTIAPDKAFGVAMALMHENGFRHLPVIDKGVPIGVVSSRSALDPELEEFVAEERRRKHLLEQL
ncbi:MAG TPA: CBS domain-containing protein [Burkholderiaceae bacterium]|nr:CBS domain-containing protein [Burkholderiaceae bacterium]